MMTAAEFGEPFKNRTVKHDIDQIEKQNKTKKMTKRWLTLNIAAAQCICNSLFPLLKLATKSPIIPSVRMANR